MKKSSKNVEELLKEAKVYWVCPVTGTKIDATDVSAIDAHKTKILKEEAQKNLEKAQEKEMRVLRKEFSKINSLEELNQWTEKLVLLKHPNIAKKDIPFFSVPVFASKEITKESNDRFYMTYAVLKINNYSSKMKKTFSSMSVVNNLNENKDHFAIVKSDLNPFVQKVYEYQIDLLKSANKKVGLEEKAILEQNKEYSGLVVQIKAVNKELHNLRKEHAVIESKMKDLRGELLGQKTFDNFLIGIEQSKKRKLKP